MVDLLNTLKTTIAGALVLVLILGWCLSSSAIAADQNVSRIRSITPMEEMSFNSLNVRAEDYFDVVGTLNLIDGGQIVVGDTKLQLAGRAKMSGVKKYDEVGVLLNKAGKVVKCVKITDEAH
jgi:hypothetical protein